jgi:uncharacterized protein YneF (UPF0154 family)
MKKFVKKHKQKLALVVVALIVVAMLFGTIAGFFFGM